MDFPIYKAEREAGLEQAIAENNSLAYITPLSFSSPSDEQKRSIAKYLSKPSIKDFDLYFLDSVLASIGWNKNTDIFDKEDTWKARHTPVHKQVNYMHNEADIIGHMVASVVVDKDGNIVDDATSIENLPNSFDVVVSSVLYKTWADQELQQRMNQLIQEIENGDWFVSMECLFRNFDYGMITPDGVHKIIARNEETAFLTKHLRQYGGKGEYDGNKIGRVLRNFTFSGKGLVRNPANDGSVILLDTTPFEAITAQETDYPIREKNNMSDTLQAQIDRLQKELDDAKAENKHLVEQTQAKAEEIHANEKQELESTIASLEQEVQDKDSALAEKDEEISKLNEQVEAKDEQVAELTEEKEALEADKVKAERTSLLVEAGVDSESAAAVVEKWTSASDEQFADVVQLHKDKLEAAFDKMKDEEDKEKKKGKADVAEAEEEAEAAKADDADLEDAEADADPNLSTEDENEAAEAIQATANYIGELLGRTDN